MDIKAKHIHVLENNVLPVGMLNSTNFYVTIVPYMYS